MKTFKQLLENNITKVKKIAIMATAIHKIKNKKERTITQICYNELFQHLIKLKPINTNYYIFVKKVTDNFNKKIKYITVTGKKKKDKNQYTLGFTKWQEWLSMKVKTEFTEEKTIANCLFDMTFYGFKQKTIKKLAKRLEKSARDLKSGKLKTVPVDLDELKECIKNKIKKKIKSKK